MTTAENYILTPTSNKSVPDRFELISDDGYLQSLPVNNTNQVSNPINGNNAAPEIKIISTESYTPAERQQINETTNELSRAIAVYWDENYQTNGIPNHISIPRELRPVFYNIAVESAQKYPIGISDISAYLHEVVGKYLLIDDYLQQYNVPVEDADNFYVTHKQSINGRWDTDLETKGLNGVINNINYKFRRKLENHILSPKEFKNKYGDVYPNNWKEKFTNSKGEIDYIPLVNSVNITVLNKQPIIKGQLESIVNNGGAVASEALEHLGASRLRTYIEVALIGRNQTDPVYTRLRPVLDLFRNRRQQHGEHPIVNGMHRNFNQNNNEVEDVQILQALIDRGIIVRDQAGNFIFRSENLLEVKPEKPKAPTPPAPPVAPEAQGAVNTIVTDLVNSEVTSLNGTDNTLNTIILNDPYYYANEGAANDKVDPLKKAIIEDPYYYGQHNGSSNNIDKVPSAANTQKQNRIPLNGHRSSTISYPTLTTPVSNNGSSSNRIVIPNGKFAYSDNPDIVETVDPYEEHSLNQKNHVYERANKQREEERRKKEAELRNRLRIRQNTSQKKPIASTQGSNNNNSPVTTRHYLPGLEM